MQAIVRSAALTIVLLIVAVFFTAGCQARAGGQTTGSAQAQAPAAAAAADRLGDRAPVCAVFGIDCSNSYDMPDAARTMFAASVRKEARPGDTLFFRRIVANSYADGAALLTARFVAWPVEPQNPFDARLRARLRAREQEFARTRNAVAARLDAFSANGLAPSDRHFTDVYGFLQKAGEILQKAPSGATRFVVLASDLRDNRNHRHLEINLQGAHVVVALFQNKGAPEELLTLRRFWRAEFQRLGATSVELRDPSEGLADGFLRGTR
jgi:hypothetical protein